MYTEALKRPDFAKGQPKRTLGLSGSTFANFEPF